MHNAPCFLIFTTCPGFCDCGHLSRKCFKLMHTLESWIKVEAGHFSRLPLKWKRPAAPNYFHIGCVSEVILSSNTTACKHCEPCILCICFCLFHLINEAKWRYVPVVNQELWNWSSSCWPGSALFCLFTHISVAWRLVVSPLEIYCSLHPDWDVICYLMPWHVILKAEFLRQHHFGVHLGGFRGQRLSKVSARLMYRC